ncbi:hypothetical protein MAE02_62460 [Microvirga aerophila]|uniref:Uncharacterized protein n=1 Tax=Microvirga aerophila TaxID=670291 RepID=A0A512C2W1_9HYPH|nr:hypothetical protein MAE02_62460 [Microvirga aerophila]
MQIVPDGTIKFRIHGFKGSLSARRQRSIALVLGAPCDVARREREGASGSGLISALAFSPSY